MKKHLQKPSTENIRLIIIEATRTGGGGVV